MAVKNTLILVFILSFFAGNGQVMLNQVQFDKIQEIKIREYVQNQIESGVRSFGELKPSVAPDDEVDGFRIHGNEYVVKDSLHRVWEHYLFTGPQESWNGGKLTFGFLYSGKDDSIFYADDHISKMDTGQIIYLNLKLMKGVKNLAVAFEITLIDEPGRTIEFSYIENNTTEGKQQLQFSETKKGYTKITHRTFFKSKSYTREHYFYPYFHTRMTNGFHRNMKKLYKAKHRG